MPQTNKTASAKPKIVKAKKIIEPAEFDYSAADTSDTQVKNKHENLKLSFVLVLLLLSIGGFSFGGVITSNTNQKSLITKNNDLQEENMHLKDQIAKAKGDPTKSSPVNIVITGNSNKKVNP